MKEAKEQEIKQKRQDDLITAHEKQLMAKIVLLEEKTKQEAREYNKIVERQGKEVENERKKEDDRKKHRLVNGDEVR